MALNVKNLEGNEIADDYVRTPQTRGRWGETWDAFKGNFGKIILINLMILFFCLPAVGILIVRSLYISAMGLLYPLNANTGIGYPVYPGAQNFAESIHFNADLLFYSLLIIGGFIMSVGIAGGAYSLKKLVNTHGTFSFKGFFHGVKVGYFNTVVPVTVFIIFFLATSLIGDWKDLEIARGNAAAGPITAYVFIIIATVIVGVYLAWLFAVGISYRLKFSQLFKNAFVLMIGSPVQTIFMIGFALIPVWIYMIGLSVAFMKIIAFILFIFFGLSFILLCWTSFTQWVFDLYVTPNYKAAKADADAKKTPEQLALEKEEDEKRIARELLAAGRSELISKPILPIADEPAIVPLGVTYNRGDVKRLSDDRQKLGSEIVEYEKQHINDTVYAEYNKLFAEREKALQDGGKKGKKKKVSRENLLK